MMCIKLGRKNSLKKRKIILHPHGLHDFIIHLHVDICELLQLLDALQGREAAAPQAEKAELSALSQRGQAAAWQVLQGH